MRLLTKEVGRRKQGREVIYLCPVCGDRKVSDAKLELNLDTGVYHCFRCGLSGKDTSVSKSKKNYSDKKDPLALLLPVPSNLERLFKERGVDFTLTVHRYRILFDGERLCIPVSNGYWKRSIYEGVEPKVLNTPDSHGLLGEELIGEESTVVITEGDFKAFSIPLPFIGVALGGTEMSEKQLDALLYHRPYLVILWLDKGKEKESTKIKKKLSKRLVDTVVVTGQVAPDDMTMAERTNVLFQAIGEVR